MPAMSNRQTVAWSFHPSSACSCVLSMGNGASTRRRVSSLAVWTREVSEVARAAMEIDNGA